MGNPPSSQDSQHVYLEDGNDSNSQGEEIDYSPQRHDAGSSYNDLSTLALNAETEKRQTGRVKPQNSNEQVLMEDKRLKGPHEPNSSSTRTPLKSRLPRLPSSAQPDLEKNGPNEVLHPDLEQLGQCIGGAEEWKRCPEPDGPLSSPLNSPASVSSSISYQECIFDTPVTAGQYSADATPLTPPSAYEHHQTSEESPSPTARKAQRVKLQRPDLKRTELNQADVPTLVEESQACAESGIESRASTPDSSFADDEFEYLVSYAEELFEEDSSEATSSKYERTALSGDAQSLPYSASRGASRGTSCIEKIPFHSRSGPSQSTEADQTPFKTGLADNNASFGDISEQANNGVSSQVNISSVSRSSFSNVTKSTFTSCDVAVETKQEVTAAVHSLGKVSQGNIRPSTGCADRSNNPQKKPLQQVNDAKVELASSSLRRHQEISVTAANTVLDVTAMTNLLELDRRTCVGTTKRRMRCKISVKQNWKQAEKYLESLTSIILGRDIEILSKILKDLALSVLCKDWHQDQVQETVTGWISKLNLRVEEWSSWESVKATQCFEAAQNAHIQQLTLYSKTGSKQQGETIKTVETTGLTAASVFDNFLPYTVETRNLVAYRPSEHEGKSTEQCIQFEISKRFSSRELKHGWIYVYCLPGNHGLVKIGHTGRSVETRLREWRDNCKHETWQMYPLSQTDWVPVQHVFRVEMLVHAELASRRRKELHCGCKVSHIEWFEESVEHVLQVVRRWTAWMRTDPYEEVNSTWKLKPTHQKDLARLCQPTTLPDILSVHIPEMSPLKTIGDTRTCDRSNPTHHMLAVMHYFANHWSKAELDGTSSTDTPLSLKGHASSSETFQDTEIKSEAEPRIKLEAT